MGKFSGKTLLVLGSNVSSVDIVTYAKKNGAHTIVADYLPKDSSEAKQMADEDLLISTADIQSLKQVVLEKNITGILAGVSEFNLLRAEQLSRLCGLSSFFSLDQYNQIESKQLFRNLCNSYNIPTPATYYIGSENKNLHKLICKYPVIVKPVDSSSSIGITICKDAPAVMEAQNIALQFSDSQQIIVEEFVVGDEFTATYTIANGRATLSAMDNRFPISCHSDSTTIPIFRLYPSTFLPEYIKQVNSQMMELCDSLHLEVATLFVQGLYNKSLNRFAIFEGGLRCAGEAPYRFLEHVNSVNYLKMIVDYTLRVPIDYYDYQKEDPFLHGKVCGVLSYVSKGGIVGSINGYEDILPKMKTIVCAECRYKVGSTIPNGDTLRQIVLRFVLVCDNKDEMINTINDIVSNVSVLDCDGNNLCIPFDSSRVQNEFTV